MVSEVFYLDKVRHQYILKEVWTFLHVLGVELSINSGKS